MDTIANGVTSTGETSTGTAMIGIHAICKIKLGISMAGKYAIGIKTAGKLTGINGVITLIGIITGDKDIGIIIIIQ